MSLVKRKQARIDEAFGLPGSTSEAKQATAHDELDTRSVSRFLSLDECSAVRQFLEVGAWKARPNLPSLQSFVEVVAPNSDPHLRPFSALPRFLVPRVEEMTGGTARVTRIDVFKLEGTKQKLVQVNPEDHDGDSAVLVLGGNWLMELRRLRSSETARNRFVVRLNGGTLLFFPAEASRLYEKNIPAGKSYPVSKSMSITRTSEFEFYVMSFYCNRERRKMFKRYHQSV
jgi:hypothetical protein